MRCSLTLALLTLLAWPAAAQENEAEKLFRELEQKVRAAKTLQVRFDAIMTGPEVKPMDDKKKAEVKKWHVKGSVILGEGDKYRAEYEGNLFGQDNKRTLVSDGGFWTGFGHTQRPGEAQIGFSGGETPDRTPKAIGAYLRPALPRDGFVLCFITDRRSQLMPDHFIIADFNLAGEEKIGERNTQVIQYTVKAKAKDPSFGTPNVNLTTMKLPMKMWLDTKTKLPVKLVMTAGDSQWNTITETYSEFTIDAKVDAKLFELPK